MARGVHAAVALGLLPRPTAQSHGSYWFYWTTENEVAWKDNYRLWMTFVNDYKNHGGRVTVGTDSGYIYELYGFAYIRELELLREAGFHPLEVIRTATLKGAEALGIAKEIGSVEPGKLADLVVVAENPLENLKVLYGTGALKLNDKNEPVRVGGVRYTIKDGIVYDARKLLADVRKMVTGREGEGRAAGAVSAGDGAGEAEGERGATATRPSLTTTTGRLDHRDVGQRIALRPPRGRRGSRVRSCPSSLSLPQDGRRGGRRRAQGLPPASCRRRPSARARGRSRRGRRRRRRCRRRSSRRTSRARANIARASLTRGGSGSPGFQPA